MVEIETGGPAFPVPANEPIHPGTTGMMLRDYFAAKAMQGQIAGIEGLEFGNKNGMRELASTCYEMADAMLEARK